jgi:hypothetical protein
MTLNLINPTSLVESAAGQQLATDLTLFSNGITVITDTWFTAQHTDQSVDIDGYHLYWKDCVRKKGGGV